MKTMQCLHVIPPPLSFFILAFLVVPREVNVNNISLIVFLVVIRLSLQRKDRDEIRLEVASPLCLHRSSVSFFTEFHLQY
jgi:hypothetical protein